MAQDFRLCFFSCINPIWTFDSSLTFFRIGFEKFTDIYEIESCSHFISFPLFLPLSLLRSPLYLLLCRSLYSYPSLYPSLYLCLYLSLNPFLYFSLHLSLYEKKLSRQCLENTFFTRHFV
jgi:hypothetical protein